jgi:hypothetical protein
MTAKEKILDVHNKLIDNTESFEPIAISLCYLYPAILNDSYIDIDRSTKQGKTFYKILDDNFKSTHFIWKHVKIYD